MKKIIILIIAIFITSSSCTSNKSCKLCKSIDYPTLQSNLLDDDKDDFILIFKQKDCSACLEYNKSLNSTLKKYKKITFYSFDYQDFLINDFQTSRYAILANYAINYYKEKDIDYSQYLDELGDSILVLPTTIAFLDGEVVNAQIGQMSTGQLKTFIKSSNL